MGISSKDDSKKNELESVMNHLANAIFVASMLYKPVLVKASDKTFDQLGIPEDLRSYNSLKNFGCIGGFKVNKGDPLFPRLDVALEVDYIQNLMKNN